MSSNTQYSSRSWLLYGNNQHSAQAGLQGPLAPNRLFFGLEDIACLPSDIRFLNGSKRQIQIIRQIQPCLFSL